MPLSLDPMLLDYIYVLYLSQFLSLKANKKKGGQKIPTQNRLGNQNKVEERKGRETLCIELSQLIFFLKKLNLCFKGFDQTTNCALQNNNLWLHIYVLSPSI